MTRTLAQEVGKKDPFKSGAQEAFLNIIRTGAQLDAPFKTLFRKYGLSPTAYNLLRILRGHESTGCRCSTLREQLVVRVPDITRLVDRLCKAGFVTRKPDPKDARAVIVRITSKGLRTLSALDDQVVNLHEAQLGHLSDDELNTLNRLLEKARDHP